MIPLRSDVTQLTASLLGDTQNLTSPQLYSAAFQSPFLNLSYQELFAKLMSIGAEQVQGEAYFLLPANTSALVPATASITNFGSPLLIYERGSATAYAISAMTPGTGTCAVTVASLPSTVVTGSMIEIYGVVGLSDVAGTWAITVNSPTSITLNGPNPSGTYVSGGFVIASTEQWSPPLIPRLKTSDFPVNSVGSALGMYCWQGGVLKFPVCSGARELKLIYELSSSLPVVPNPVSSDSMGIDDSLAFLANRTAQYCGASKGNPRAQALQTQADFFLGLRLQNAVRAMQAGETVIAGAFRPPRNVGGRTAMW